jgi:hypothetical protein
VKANDAKKWIAEFVALVSKADWTPVQKADACMVLKTLERSIGGCDKCYGKGSLVTSSKIHNSGYRLRKTRNGADRYEYPCAVCGGKGQILEAFCVSCGVKFETEFGMPEATDPVWSATRCKVCSDEVENRTGLIPYGNLVTASPSLVTKTEMSAEELNKLQKTEEEGDKKELEQKEEKKNRKGKK